MKTRLAIWFLVAQCLAGIIVFQDALWGKSLLAPLDILPALFSKFRALDPASDGVPENHHTIDQVTYDLPLQWTVYQAMQRGETPWWDPYTFSGRPLIADAHVSAVDPVRWLVYHFLPFELAYNWTRVLHHILFGLGMWLLLLRLGFQPLPSLLLSLACEFGGGFSAFFGHPWVHASFVYYPFLWIAWEAALEGRRWGPGAACLCVAAVLYSGNLQSHPYLIFFAVAFLFGQAGLNWQRWLRVMFILGITGVAGALIAAPILSAELELFLLSPRPLRVPGHPLGWAAGLVSGASMYPWALGTFKTLDLSKLVGRPFHVGFTVFIGCAAFWLAWLGGVTRANSSVQVSARRVALWLVGFYLLIISSPLNEYLYMRCAPMALIGLTVLAAGGFQSLCDSSDRFKKLGWAVIVATGFVALAANVGGLLIYPRVLPRVEQFVARAAAAHTGFDQATELRAAQIRRLPSEITFQNPETILGFLGAAGVAVFLLSPRIRRTAWAGPLLLIVNLVPVLLFTGRFIPHQPVELWHKLRAGTPEHQRVLSLLQGTPKRLSETAPGLHERLFPNALPCLYGIHSVQGYAALAPRNLSSLPPGSGVPVEDVSYESPSRGLAAGNLRTAERSSLARFYWSDAAVNRSFTVIATNLCRMQILLEPGAAGDLIWNDTRFPGWRAELDGQAVELRPFAEVASAVSVPSGAKRLTLAYEPAALKTSVAAAWIGLAIAFGVLGLRLDCVGRTALKDGRVEEH